MIVRSQATRVHEFDDDPTAIVRWDCRALRRNIVDVEVVNDSGRNLVHLALHYLLRQEWAVHFACVRGDCLNHCAPLG
jgi:hypothetical protein